MIATYRRTRERWVTAATSEYDETRGTADQGPYTPEYSVEVGEVCGEYERHPLPKSRGPKPTKPKPTKMFMPKSVKTKYEKNQKDYLKQIGRVNHSR